MVRLVPFQKVRTFFRQELALPSPSFFVFAARIEIPGERCDQLSESAHAGSVRKIAGSRQQVLPITLIPLFMIVLSTVVLHVAIAMGIRGGSSYLPRLPTAMFT